MANVLLTQSCVRSCPYCFAKKHMGDSSPDDMLSWDNLIYIADLLETSGENQISLLGGEPFLHPEIAEFILYLNSRNFYVTIFTSGVIPEGGLETFRDKIMSIKRLNLSFVCNVNDPKKTSSLELSKVHRFLKTFANQTTLSFNIYNSKFDLTFLFDYIVSFGLNPYIRFGVAHPIPGEKNHCIMPEDFKLMKDRFLSFGVYFDKYSVVPNFDCGFPMCIFSEEELGQLYKLSSGRISFKCGPVIDIGPDMSVWNCFPLSGFHKKSLFEFSSTKHISDFYIDKIQQVRNEAGGIYPQCDTCKYRINDLCSGGCVAHILNHIMNEEPCRSNIDI